MVSPLSSDLERGSHSHAFSGCSLTYLNRTTVIADFRLHRIAD